MIIFRGQPTCQAGQKNLIGALICRFVIIGNHRKSKTSIIERMASNDAQVLQRNPGYCIEGDQDVATNFFD